MIDDVRRLLVRELRAFVREVEQFPDDESLFRTVPGAAVVGPCWSMKAV